MQHTLKYCLALCFLFICFSLKAAPPITHNFQSMIANSKLTNVGSVYTSADDGITYTLAGKAEFFWDYLHPSGGVGAKMCLNFTKNEDNAIISPISNLNGVTINYMIDKDMDFDDYISVYLSTDGSSWNSITPTLSYSSTRIDVTPPSVGSYYVKIACAKNARISISQIIYTTTSGDCNCFPYTAE